MGIRHVILLYFSSNSLLIIGCRLTDQGGAFWAPVHEPYLIKVVKDRDGATSQACMRQRLRRAAPWGNMPMRPCAHAEERSSSRDIPALASGELHGLCRPRRSIDSYTVSTAHTAKCPARRSTRRF